MFKKLAEPDRPVIERLRATTLDVVVIAEMVLDVVARPFGYSISYVLSDWVSARLYPLDESDAYYRWGEDVADPGLQYEDTEYRDQWSEDETVSARPR
jgi:hypothetical protein